MVYNIFVSKTQTLTPFSLKVVENIFWEDDNSWSLIYKIYKSFQGDDSQIA